MAKRTSNQLPNNLPQLQNLIKRDAESYQEEFQQQFRHFESTLAVFELSPSEFSAPLDELVMFLAQISKCYTEQLKQFPTTLVNLLHKHSTVLDPNMRLSFCRALILLRHKGLIDAVQLHKLFFQLLRCQDKSLRAFLRDNIVNDIKTLNSKGKDQRVNTEIQNFMYSMLKDPATVAAKTSLDVMTTLYKKNVWRDEKTVNIIATGCFSKVTKILVTAAKFFLGSDEDNEEEESDDEDLPTLKEVAMQNKFNKKTRKREKYLENIKKAHKKKKRKSQVQSYNFSALHLIHDPHEFAEKLFKKLEGLTEKFEVKLLLLELVSRLIGTHELVLLNFYPYVSRFLAPHQREVVRLLQFSAQAAHSMVPPDSVEPVLKAIVNNFVTERNAAEVMAVGLNAIREICARCPLVMTEDLLRDLVEYKTYKDKGVMMASRSIIQLFRELNPDLLHKRDRGRPTEATLNVKARQFGEENVMEFIPGAEVLKNDEIPEDEWGDESDEEKKDKEKPILSLEEKAHQAKEITEGKVLTDEDFRRIDAAQLKKEVVGVRKGGKGKKRTAQEADLDDLEEIDKGRNELVNLDDIEMVYSKKRHDKEARMESIMQGREGREKFGGGKKTKKDGASMTNKQKSKKKNFSMMKHKIKTKGKKSFREKQMALKKRLIKQAGRK